jgi:ABC-type tungstate transport system substrate-binding protein
MIFLLIKQSSIMINIVNDYYYSSIISHTVQYIIDLTIDLFDSMSRFKSNLIISKQSKI